MRYLQLMRLLIRNLLAACFLGALTTGCVFSLLEGDLEQLDDAFHLFAGEVTTANPDSHAIVVVALHDTEARDIVSFRMLGDPGIFEIRANSVPTYFFAFSDVNRDLVFQVDEPYGWANNGRALDPGKEQTEQIRIVIDDTDGSDPTWPRLLADERLENHLNNYATVSIGTVTSLNSPLFSREQSEKGLWTPFAFVEDGGAGIHFLEEFDPDRIPVLFVHGINGTPRDFTTIIDALDEDRYQAWVMSYPSGLRLSWVARGMYQFVDYLNRVHDFDELHVVAHSMGGLVSRGGLNLCTQNRNCSYLASYTSISTPWNGVASAKNGVKWAPTVVPVWHDLDPDSEYVTTLFDTELPDELPYHLLFGYRTDGILGSESSDGVILLNSQLRYDAQLNAETVLGFDEGHVSILENGAVIDKILQTIEDHSNP